MNITRLSRRAAIWRLGAGSLAVLATACSPTAAPAPTSSESATNPAPPLTIALANSELVVGLNRVALGLIGPDNQPITDAQAVMAFYELEGNQGTKRGELPAVYRWVEYRQRGVYVSRVMFDKPGPWGLEVVARATPEAAPVSARVTIDVKDHVTTPVIGDHARATRSLTVADVSDLATICSNAPPCSLHTLSIEQAVQSGCPSLLAFATPGFCTSLTCAPQLGVVLGLAPRYAGRAEFVHIEIYKEPRDRILADAVTEWQLMSEPWIFIVDRNGVIRDRYEGIATEDELIASLDAVL